VPVIHGDTGDCQAWNFIDDEENVERIADILSSKYLGAAAMELREMVRLDRRGLLPRPKLTLAAHRERRARPAKIINPSRRRRL